MTVGRDRRMLVFVRETEGRIERYEVEEGLSKTKGGKSPGLDQSAVDFKERREEHVCVARAIVQLLFRDWEIAKGWV